MSELTIEHAGLLFEVEVLDYYPGHPAYISGPPEDCYPEEYEEIEYHISRVNLPDDSDLFIGDIDEDEFERLVLEAYKDSLLEY
jgi:hypothetical protein